jgi:hypothetical protein
MIAFKSRTRGDRITIVRDDAGQEGNERGMLFVGQVKVLHGPMI